MTPLDDSLLRLRDIATCEDPRARRRRAAALLLQLDEAALPEARRLALALGLLDEAGLRRVDFVRAQELPEAAWSYRAFLLLERPFDAEPVVVDGDELEGARYTPPE